MKIQKHRFTADEIERGLNSIDSLFRTYQPGDIKTLGEFSRILVMTFEYWNKYRNNSIIKCRFLSRILTYHDTLYTQQVCLVLNAHERFFRYTRNNIVKAIRGYVHHGDHEDKNLKEAILRRFIMEEDDTSNVTFEMFITREWIVTPGIYLKTGNKDSNGPYRNKWMVEGSETKDVSLIEAIVLNIYEEVRNIMNYGFLHNNFRDAMLTEKKVLLERFGAGLGQEVYEVLEWHRKSRARKSIL